MIEIDQAEADGADPRAGAYVRSLEKLQSLRTEGMEPVQFWDELVRVLAGLAEAESAAIMTRASQVGAAWRVVALAPKSIGGGPVVTFLAAQLDEVREECIRRGIVHWQGNGSRLAALRLETGSGDEVCMAAFVLEPSSGSSPKEIDRRLLLASGTPSVYQAQRVAVAARKQVERLAGALDLLVLLNEKKRFVPAAMTFCNEIASRLGCERASLGWSVRGYVRVQATSHVDRFERTTDAVQMLETAMEEAMDQDSEVTWPENARAEGQ